MSVDNIRNVTANPVTSVRAVPGQSSSVVKSGVTGDALNKFKESLQERTDDKKQDKKAKQNVPAGYNNRTVKVRKGLSRDELLSEMRQQQAIMKAKIKNGETEPKIRIGGNEYTASEWEKLLKNVDDSIDSIKENVKKEISNQLKQQEKKKWEEEYLQENKEKEIKIDKNIDIQEQKKRMQAAAKYEDMINEMKYL